MMPVIRNIMNNIKYIRTIFNYCFAICLLFGCSANPTTAPTNPEKITFAVIGDYGANNAGEASVAALVNTWNPDFIITTGDNNYFLGEASTIDANVGKYFHGYIHPYTGAYGEGATINRFYPSLGNHDWYSGGSLPSPYLNYFTLPGNERYYNFTWGSAEFFAIDSDPNEPDGISADSIQAIWLKNKLASSVKKFKIVYFHHPPYSSGPHGSTVIMQWPFKEWGADCVLSGHDHTYERIIKDQVLFFVNGIGGESIYNFNSAVDGSQFRYNSKYGAMLVEVSESSAVFKFYNIDHELIDTYELTK